MSRLLTVNQALDDLPKLAGQDVSIQGILHFEFEDIAVYHFPQSERKEDCQSAIWLSTGMGGLGFNEDACQRLNGKRVVVTGTLFQPDPHFGGCGHMSVFPAELLARTLERA